MKRYKVLALIYLAVALVTGYLLSQQISAFLGIEINPKPLPEVILPPARPPAEALSPLAPYETIVLPAGALADERYQQPVDELVAALLYRTGSRPDVVEASQADNADRIILLRDEADGGTAEPGSFTLRGQEGSLTVEAGDPLGGIYGLYYLAGQLKSGVQHGEAPGLDLEVTPAMGYRLVDMGGVGVTPDEELWQAHDYSHHLRAFEDVIQAEAPYIDQEAMVRVKLEFQEYVQRMIAFGYNGIIFDGFLEYIDFDKVGDGQVVYEADSAYRQQHAAMREAFGDMLSYADEMGLQVIFQTDMLVFSDPLANYFEQTLGGIEASDPALWEVYKLGLAELFEWFPYIDGLMIRIGEAGPIYDLEGWEYSSSLDVRTDEAVRMMLEELAGVAADHDKTLFFRSWSVGIGEVGNMHTNPDTYERVLGEIDLPNLVVSTKYTMGDYYSYLPLNPTLATGDQRRIIEFQARREFEAFNAFPNYLGPEHQVALQELGAANPNIEGVWLWTQRGGPQRAGPWSIYPFHGFWQTYDDTVYATAQLAWNPDADLQDLTESWIRLTLSDDPQTVSNLAQMATLSREATLKGLYIGEFAKNQILAMGLEPPPQFWMFEWDIISGSSAALSAVYQPVAEKLDLAIAEGFEAVELVRQMRGLVEGSDPATFYRPELYDKLVESLAYEENLFETLAWYRQVFLNYYHWLNTGDPGAYQAWQEAGVQFNELKEGHLATYGDNFDFPAYNFFAVEAGMAHAERSELMMWLSRILLLVMLATLLAGASPVQRRLPEYPGKWGNRALWVALTNPWNLGYITPSSRLDQGLVSLWPVILILAGRLLFSSFLSSAYMLLVVLLLAPFFIALLLLNRGRPRFHLWAAISGPMILMVMLPLAMVSVRGPVYYWYQFWMGPEIRTLYITVAGGVSAWLLLVLYIAQRTVYRKPRSAAVGNLLLAMSGSLILLGAVVYFTGLERALTTINNQLAVLPLGLSMILGITVHLEIPLDLPLYMVIFGLVLALVGGLLNRLKRGGPPVPAVASVRE